MITKRARLRSSQLAEPTIIAGVDISGKFFLQPM